jgi:BirA family biotin operon repressor/biotin-[acetyl-CoA-carboxylase] ligase
MARSLFELMPPTRWVGHPLHLYREVDSTNLVAERLAARGAPEGLLVLADAQSAGRGRLGRSFFSPGGRSIYLSLLLRPRMDPERLPQHVFVAARAVAETVEAHLPDAVPVEIKWPNDVLIGGKKTSGINLPAQAEGGRIRSVVLGIGVNVNTRKEEFPSELQPIATSLAAAGATVLDRVGLCEELLDRLETGIERLRQQGFRGVLDGWRKYFRMQGQLVRVGGPGVPRAIEGVVQDLDPDGALLLRSDQAVVRILAGDVTIVRREA